MKEQYLTFDQSKELQNLGVNFNNAKCKLVHSIREVVQGFEKFEYIPTLSVSEMKGYKWKHVVGMITEEGCQCARVSCEYFWEHFKKK